VTHLHFAEKADGEQVHPQNQQNRSKQHERPVGGDNIRVVQQLLHHEPNGNAAAGEDAQHAAGAEEMQRPG
jgi:hypothetical protein